MSEGPDGMGIWSRGNAGTQHLWREGPGRKSPTSPPPSPGVRGWDTSLLGGWVAGQDESSRDGDTRSQHTRPSGMSHDCWDPGDETWRSVGLFEPQCPDPHKTATSRANSHSEVPTPRNGECDPCPHWVTAEGPGWEGHRPLSRLPSAQREKLEHQAATLGCEPRRGVWPEPVTASTIAQETQRCAQGGWGGRLRAVSKEPRTGAGPWTTHWQPALPVPPGGGIPGRLKIAGSRSCCQHHQPKSNPSTRDPAVMTSRPLPWLPGQGPAPSP